MFGIGPLEIIIIVLFALIFVGPKRLPEVARQFGKFFVQVRRMSSDVRNTIDDAIREAEQDLLLEERKKLQKELEQQQLRAQNAAQQLLDEVGSHGSSDDPTLKPTNEDHPSAPKWDNT